jgi:GDPmannose 4,6-dehydratase
MKTALIFGADGQDGYYLRKLCQGNGIFVQGFALEGSSDCQIGDISDFATVERLVNELQPDYIFHLAAVSTTRHEALFKNHAAITTGTINVLEAVRIHKPSCRVFLAGSGVQFVNTGSPISEKDLFDGSSAYAVSRIESVYWARYYRSLGIKAYVGYLFHHESPLRKPNHLCRKITDLAKRVREGSKEQITLGDLSVRKEVGFAGDIVAGIWTLVNQDQILEATIGTGKAYSIQEWIEVCFSKVGHDWRDHVTMSTDAFVPEYPLLVSDPTSIFSLGWKPTVDINGLAEMMLK